MPQPNLVPVRRSVSRRNQSSGIDGSPSCSYGLPLIVIASAATGAVECGFAGGSAWRSGVFCMRFSVRRRIVAFARVSAQAGALARLEIRPRERFAMREADQHENARRAVRAELRAGVATARR